MAIIFACYHILYGWPPMIAFTGPFVWAMLFGTTALWSKGIAIPTGIHFSLNVLQNISRIKGGNPAAILELSASKSDMTRIETVALLLHFIMLILFLLLTLYYAKRIASAILSPTK